MPFAYRVPISEKVLCGHMSESSVGTIPWQPTPHEETKKLSGLERRLKDVQDALKGQVVSLQSTFCPCFTTRADEARERSLQSYASRQRTKLTQRSDKYVPV